MKILLAGDSFAAEWPNSTTGWPHLIKQHYDVDNVAQAGVSEYKIFKQIQNANLNKYDLVIVSHTHPGRIHTPKHPIHRTGLHKDCDLILADLEAKTSYFNKSLQIAKGWFKYHYDEQYQNDMYTLLRNEINRLINIPYISIDNFNVNVPHNKETINLNFSQFWLTSRGKVNHYSDLGNQYVYCEVNKVIDNIIKKSV